jgi:aspartate carbamoyltransferase regulatory subunit
MTDADKQGKLNVTAIRHGTVIDHIESSATFQVASILQVEDETNIVLVGVQLESKRLGKKGLIKIEDRRLTPDEVNKIALIAPRATLNIISDFQVVEKFKVELPERIERIVRCNNPNCITNKEDIQTKFDVVKKAPLSLRCNYCERVVKRDNMLLK